MVVSCNTTKAGKTTLIQTKQPAGNTLNILINDSGKAMNRVMDRIYRLADVTDMQVKTNDNFLNPDWEIRKFIKDIPYKQINEIRSNAL